MATYDRKLSIALFLSFTFSLSLIHQSVASKTKTGNLPEEKKALYYFYQKVKINTTKLNWNNGTHVCQWEGIKCGPDNKYVMGLILPAQSIAGEIPNNSIGKLTSLHYLSLHGNNFTGPIPSDFSNLHSLHQFVLHSNSFSGHLPNLDAEKILPGNFNVSMNKLSGCIPKSLSKFDKSSFSGNNNLCHISAPNNNHCFNICPAKPASEEKPKKKFPTGAIVGIAVGSPLLLLVLMACLRKDRNL